MDDLVDGAVAAGSHDHLVSSLQDSGRQLDSFPRSRGLYQLGFAMQSSTWGSNLAAVPRLACGFKIT